MNWRACLIILPVCFFAYLLYIKGFAVSKNIRAILFAFRPGKNADKATLNSCTGWVQHVGRFHETGAYEFTLDCHLSEGAVTVFLSDRKKLQLLKLNRQSPSGMADLAEKSRYYVRWEFESASGNCELHWQKKYIQRKNSQNNGTA